MPVKKNDDSQVKKPAARKTTKTAAKKTAENKTTKKTTRKTAAKNEQSAEMAMIAAEENKGAEMIQAIDALGEKAAEKKTEAEMNAIAAETQKGAAIEAAVEKMEEGKEAAAPVKKTRKTTAKTATKKKAAAKTAAPSKEAVMEEIKNETVKGAEVIAAEAAMEAAQEQKDELNAIAAETEKGAAIEEAIAKTEEAKPVKKTTRKTAAKTAAKKTTKKAAAKTEEAKPAKKAEVAPSKKEELETIAEEVKKGAEIIAAESEVKPEPAEAAIETVQKEIAAETEKGAGIEQAVADLGKKVEAKQVKKAQEEALEEEKPAAKSKAKEEESVQEEVKKAPELTEEKEKFYASFSDQTLLDMANAMGLGKSLDELKAELQQTVDIAGEAAAKMTELPKADDYAFEEDGFDVTVVPVLYERIAKSLPYRASDRQGFADRITADIARPLINEGVNDSAIYNDLMHDVRDILMFAQQNNVTSWKDMKEKVPADLDHLLGRFMDVAYTMLPGWQYNDVKYYEGFLYGVLSQFDDLSNWHNRAMMDVADLYIKHGDFGKGDADYNYIIRENTLKDQIYYRFASVYLPIDLQKAKAVASDALQYVDGRFEYYPKIMEILNR